MSADRLRLRPLRASDERAFLAGHEEMAVEGFTFGLGYTGQPFGEYVELLDGCRHGVGLPPRWVPSTFLVAAVDDVLVGRSSIRHELNEFLAFEGGHIGYGVLPAQRRRGYATEILRQSLVIARSHGIERVLVTCDDDNTASAATIERNGGTFESHITGEAGTSMRRYWID
jgi:predicted acetyltransferase